MENNFKRFLSLLLAFVMVFGMMPANVLQQGIAVTLAYGSMAIVPFARMSAIIPLASPMAYALPVSMRASIIGAIVIPVEPAGWCATIIP